MKKIIITLLLIISTCAFFNSYGRDLDSLYSALLNLKGISPKGALRSLVNTPRPKCGFGLINAVKHNYKFFSASQKAGIDTLLDRPYTDTSIISPGGFFRIHFCTIGPDAVRYNVNHLAIALDSVYNFEVKTLGFPPPPIDNGVGGDNRYDVYLISLGYRLSGYTESSEHEITPGSQTYSSFIAIDNGFDDGSYYTYGIDAARSAVAHEFHHAIQMGNYIVRYDDEGYCEDLFFYELTSSAMEEFVFDDINSYYGDLPNYFNFTFHNFTYRTGYDLAIWNIFLQKKYGFGIIKRQWELLRQNHAMKSIDLSLLEVSSSFSQEYCDFAKWTFYTNYRAIPGMYFKEAANYPLVRQYEYTFTPPEQTLSVQPVYAPSHNFIRITSAPDTLYAVIVNSDYQHTENNHAVQYSLYNSSVIGSNKISNNYYSKFKPDDSGFWNVVEILSENATGIVDIRYSPEIVTLKQNYPNPFFRSTVISYQIFAAGNVTLKVFNIHGEDVATLINSKQKAGSYSVSLNADNLSSGVYFYTIQAGSYLETKKMVLIK